MPKPSLHPRNPHRHDYNLQHLAALVPDLNTYIKPHPDGKLTLDFAQPAAVKALNKALLHDVYDISFWDIPDGALCPAVPGRADYIHHLADLLAEDNAGEVPEGGSIRGLDIGTGASCIYPILGAQSYGWSFVGSDINVVSLKVAEQIVLFNPPLKKKVRVRLQKNEQSIFHGLIKQNDLFYFSMCNPPFHASAKEAVAATQRKLKNLSRDMGNGDNPPIQNFAGQNAELWCDGGEIGFVNRMVAESAEFAEQCLWFTCLVSKQSNIAAVKKAIGKFGAIDVKVVDMGQGNKRSRFVAWSFFSKQERSEWFI